jgi:hypothetical protein
MRDRRNVYKISVGNTEGKRPLGTRKSGWEGNIRMDVKQGRKVWNEFI